MLKKSTKTSKTNSVLLLVIIAALTFSLGYFAGALGTEGSDVIETTEDADSHLHDGEDSHAHDDEAGHMHDPGMGEEVSANPPSVKLSVSPDKKSGWNVNLEVSNFDFAPESASGEHADGEGHAHIYVDGEKISRVYSENFYLGELVPGEHEVHVTLNTNDHRDYTYRGEPVEDTVTIVQN